MHASERDVGPAVSERRMRWLALAALVVLVPCTMAATGWRDAVELLHAREWRPVDVATAQAADYDGATVRLASVDVLPLVAGLPADRTFVRTRLSLVPGASGAQWSDCRLTLVDGSGRSWAAIDTVPDLLQRALARPGEPPGVACDGLAVSAAKPGVPLAIDGYYLVPRAVAAQLQLTVSTRGGRPHFLRFAREQGHD
ncbi:hypothetical protein QE400_002453 [Xanthomonas sacchari]|uniref:hypothetical protein n=1 Tax=Xanthomonas sacchari TaxID=56458 RepID=UPI0027869CDE|nr:hypothetical protein [Xanthomonas sacchari]MDQ1093040.1 hypothetical protein [Xanthomonas sacchari]